VSAGVFLHVGFFSLSFAIAIALFVGLLDRAITENRGIAFVFLSWMFYLIPSYIYVQFCWLSQGWEQTIVDSTLHWMCFPLIGSAVSAMHLAVYYYAARLKGIRPWVKIPWWSIFMPTASVLAAGVLIEPMIELYNHLF
jgi:hypothetical protein